MASLPEHIINKINEYIPNDKDMKSPVSRYVNRLIEFYSGDVCFEACIRALYIIVEDEPFYKYALRINNPDRKYSNDELKDINQNIDRHSKKLIIANLELLLKYFSRFYDRQFITREEVHQGILLQFDQLLTDYVYGKDLAMKGLPSVAYFADCLHLSANYFGDLIKKETGKSAQEYVQNKVIEVAKERIFDHKKSVSEVAYELGFKYPQHFTRLFKQKVGQSPNEYRNSAN